MIGYKLIQENVWREVNDKLQKLKAEISSATAFVREIERGNLDVSIGTDTTDSELKTSLVNMRDQMKKYSLIEKQRNWVNEGLAKFVEILRSGNADGRQQLAESIIRNLVVYLQANQGALFALNDDDPADPFLEMAACYAYDRKKFLEKRIELGQGLAGQVVLEKSTLYMTNVPQDFLKITSGLGEALPRNILLVPLMMDDSVYGVVEIASFQVLQSYQVEFVEKLGESIASTIAAVKGNERTKALLKEKQLQAEQLQAQQEELRQNMEELSSTQEAMQRTMKEVEVKEAYISQILDTSQDIIYTVDSDFRMVTWNAVFAREAERLNIRLEKGMNAFEWSPDDRKNLIELYKRVFNGETFEITYETGIYGKIYHFPSVCAPIKSATGEVVEAAIYAKNVTPIVEAQQESARHLKEAQQQAEELKAQEEELRQNMEELSSTQEAIEQATRAAEVREEYILQLLNVSQDVIFTVDKEFRIVTWNEAFAKTLAGLGVSPQKGMIAFGWRPDGERAHFVELFKRVFTGETFEARAESKFDGKTHYFLSTFTPLRNKANEVVEAVVFARDITAIVDLQQASIQSSEEGVEKSVNKKAPQVMIRQNGSQFSFNQSQLYPRVHHLEKANMKIALLNRFRGNNTKGYEIWLAKKIQNGR